MFNPLTGLIKERCNNSDLYILYRNSNIKESKWASKNETQYLFNKFTSFHYDNNHQTRFGMYIIAQQPISNKKRIIHTSML